MKSADMLAGFLGYADAEGVRADGRRYRLENGRPYTGVEPVMIDGVKWYISYREGVEVERERAHRQPPKAPWT